MSELFKLKNGTVLVSTEAPGGIYNSAQLKKIADLCSKELAIVKATEDQRLALFVKESELDRVIGELKATGLGFRNYQEGLHQPVSCLGELCESHEQPALTTAMELTKLIADINLVSPLKIGINGCARCCTPCHTLDISVIGEAGGYRVSLGGKTSQFPELGSFFAEAVPAKELPKILTTIIELFRDKAEAGESFNEVLDRCGSEDFVAALAPYSQDAAHRDDPFAATDESASEDVGSEVSESSDNELDEAVMDDEGLAPSDDGMDSVSDSEEMEISAGEPEELSFDFSADDENVEMDEVRIDSHDEPSLSDDILVNGGEEPALENDDDLVFDDEALVSEELSASEPELIEDESIEIEAQIPDPTDETEDMPELGEELLESNEIDSSALAPDTLMLDDGDADGDEGSALDTEAERLFEEKLGASIEEDKKFRESEEVDENVSARADALRLLESASDDDLLADDTLMDSADTVLTLDDDMVEEELSADDVEIEDEMEDISELEIEESRTAAPVSQPTATPAPVKPSLAKPASAGVEFEFEGFDMMDQTLRVTFASGAYLDLQLGSLPYGKSRVFRAGQSSVCVTHEEGGYSVEGGGLKMFYPHTLLKAS